MPQPLISGFRGCKFRGFDLAPFLTSWSDTRIPSIAEHKYIKRDGGEIEPMGRKPHEVTIHLSFLGAQWMTSFRALQALIDDDPKGILTHPIYGDMNVACLGHHGARVDAESAPNLYELDLAFKEDAVDTKVQSSGQQPTPSEQLQSITVFNTGLIITAALLGEAAILGAATLTESAVAFGNAVVASNGAVLLPDPSIDPLLAVTEAATESAILAFTASTGDASDITAAIVQAEQILDACNQLADAVLAAGPIMILFVVPSRTNITSLAVEFYGKDAAARESEMLASNPQVTDPGFIPQGTQLWLAAATV